MKRVLKRQAGFTLIEILVVIFIVAALLTVTQISLTSARAKARDIRRVSDVRQVQNGLELYFHNKNKYPIAENITLGNDNYDIFCDTAAGFQADETDCASFYFKKLPLAPTPPDGNSYVYSSADGKIYSIVFSLEKVTGSLSEGEHTATQAGIQ
ncbi:hypothetical protein COT99_04000 [Candidatus Falkowbacteria bacterium CG10_big_fil_rev_8_21_14_0_10_43_10]|uniref:Type II secretion system protein GspG C-terminal domain-containing protein n=1 Tax=Candidatus Falkowbacteria bacterium CG10_big_fil_rev_8_21_14_0_10_43_10 TaxID=1974567 RepID=A0A2H0V3F2_9BACT|nr:MAG: hypothetical protein COT99_04000 [Candidatus Falkowbacteria bacterium CG10_big_fil_rev_8_21_14_0_10_43_10]